MKKILFILTLSSTVLFADYSTPNNYKLWNLDSLVVFSGGNVTFSGGVYFFNGTINISRTDTFIIRTNATVKLAPSTALNVYGTIIINPLDSVKFSAIDTAQKFSTLKLDSASSASVLRKMIFEYSFSGINLFYSNILVDSCTLRYNCIGNTLNLASAILLYWSNPVISNCKIHRNYKAAIGGGANVANAPQIINNILYENNTSNINVPQINLGQSGTDTTLIRGNIIRGFFTNAGGIATFPAVGTLNIIIENNIIKNNRYGIAIQNLNTNAIIRGNIIDSNNIQGNPMLGGSGINFLGNSTLTAVVTHNFIRLNLWGITIQNTAKPNLGNLSNTDTSDNGYNYIYGNSNNDTTYDLYNNTPDSIKAENNYWGTTNLDIIESHIFHKPDNNSLGFVDYMPILIPVFVNNNGTHAFGYKLYNAYPNPFNPSTVIKYELPKASRIELKIYDILGNEIMLLEEGVKQAGKHEITYNASNLASGVYFILLNADGNITSRKLVLLK